MIHDVVMFALGLSAANWLLFLGVTIVSNVATLRMALSSAPPKQEDGGAFRSRQEQLDKLVDSTGSLATSFRTAGSGSSAAAMSLVCLLIAAVVAGIDRF